MFSQAVALSQGGRMKSTIHAKGKELFILNMDNTILLRFDSPDNFPEKVSFFANDYESDTFETVDGKIVFTSRAGNLERTKACPVPEASWDAVNDIFNKHGEKVSKDFGITFSKGVLSLLDDGLSHVEFHNPSKIHLVQKDIYTGSVVTVTKNQDGFDFSSGSEFTGKLPIGMRTADFKALFSFAEEITFYFQPEGQFVYFEDNGGVFRGFLATCLYDELPYIFDGGAQ